MAVREILRWPDPRLSETCAPIEEVTPELRDLARDLLDTMYAAQGRGLAAPQVGAMVRMFVMDAGWKEGRSDPLVCLNPMFQEFGEDYATLDEGCLSIPGVTATISRPSSVQMVWSSLEGARVVQGFSGFAAACVQHEVDHLDGVITFDHLQAEARRDVEASYGAQT